jgi:2'-5' RNA ligase
MALKRLFTGSFIDKAILSEYYKKIKADFKNAVTGKWVEENNLHITFKFLGDIEEENIPAIKEALNAKADKPLPCEIYPGSPSSFNLKNPRILFIAADDRTGILTQLNSFCEKSLSKLGFSPETKPFNPHITLMRIKSADINTFSGLIEKFKNTDYKTGPQTEIRLSLIESVLSPSGPVYKII